MAGASQNAGSVTTIMTVGMALTNWKVCVVSTSIIKSSSHPVAVDFGVGGGNVLEKVRAITNMRLVREPLGL